MTHELALDLTREADFSDRRMAQDIKTAVALADIATNIARQKTAHERDARLEERAMWEKRLDDATAWYTHPVFVATVAVVTTGLLVFVARETIVNVR